MIKKIFILFLFLGSNSIFGAGIKLPDRSDKSIEYLSARRAIAMTESNNNPCARNKLTSASGKYQFMRGWNGFFTRFYGRTWSSVVPSCAADKSIKIRMAKHQDAMFDLYYDMHAGPFISYYRGKTKGWSDVELLALYHRSGPAGATRYLKTGRDFANGKWGNPHVKLHISRVLKNLRFELIAFKD